MKIICFIKLPAKLFGEQFANRSFPCSRDAEDNHDHGALICRRLPIFLYQKSDNHEECVENPNAYDGLPGRQWIARHICITYLDDNKGGSESNHGSFTNSRHHISRQVK